MPMPRYCGYFFIRPVMSSVRLRAKKCWSTAQPGRKPSPLLVALRGHHRVAERVAARHVLALDARAGRAAADRAAAGEHLVEALLGQRARVGIHEPPLPPAAEPHAAGLGEHLAERRVVGQLRSRRVQRHARSSPRTSSGSSPRRYSGSGSSIAVGMTTMSASGPPLASMNRFQISGVAPPPPTITSVPFSTTGCGRLRGRERRSFAARFAAARRS